MPIILALDPAIYEQLYFHRLQLSSMGDSNGPWDHIYRVLCCGLGFVYFQNLTHNNKLGSQQQTNPNQQFHIYSQKPIEYSHVCRATVNDEIKLMLGGRPMQGQKSLKLTTLTWLT